MKFTSVFIECQNTVRTLSPKIIVNNIFGDVDVFILREIKLKSFFSLALQPPLWVVIYSPQALFSLLAYEVS